MPTLLPTLSSPEAAPTRLAEALATRSESRSRSFAKVMNAARREASPPRRRDAEPEALATNGTTEASPQRQRDADPEAVTTNGTPQTSHRRDQPTSQQTGSDAQTRASSAQGLPESGDAIEVSGRPAHGGSASNARPAPVPSAAAQPPPVQEQPPAQRTDTAHRRGSDEAAGTRNPALGRATQVQAAVLVENATGQPPVSQGLGVAGGAPAASSMTVGSGALVLEHPVPATATGPDDGPAQFSARILRGLTTMFNQRGGVMTMRLHPPELGELRIQMTLAQGRVTAEFRATTPSAHALLERSLTILRTALETHGLSVDRLTVQPLPSVQARHTAPDEQPQQRPQHDAGSGQSRGRRDGDPESSQRGTPSAETFDPSRSSMP